MAPLTLILLGSALADGPAASGPEAGAGALALTVRVDDALLGDLSAPVLRVGSAPPAPLRDDGSVPGDLAGDRVWSARLTLRPSPRVEVAVQDGDRTWGPLVAFLPASSSAELRLRTTETPPGLELVTEPVATAPVRTPGSSSPAAAPDERVAYVLWLALLFAALGVAWVRQVVRAAWREEVRPVLRKLDRWLDSQESREDP